MIFLKARKKKIFVFAAVLHALLVSAISVADPAGKYLFSKLLNLAFLFIYAAFFLYCLFDGFLSCRKLRGWQLIMRRLPFFLVHVSSLLLVIGLIYNQLYFYSGSIILTEGEVFSKDSSPHFLTKKGLLTENKEFDRFVSETEIQLLELEFDENNFPKSVRLALRESEGEKILTFGPNKPARFGDHYFFSTAFSGFSPRIKIIKDGIVYFDAFLALKSSEKKGFFEDRFNIGPLGKITFSYQPEKKRFYIIDDKGRVLSTGGYDDPAVINDMVITLEEVRKWLKIDISMDRTASFMFFCSSLLLASIALALIEKRGGKN